MKTEDKIQILNALIKIRIALDEYKKFIAFSNSNAYDELDVIPLNSYNIALESTNKIALLIKKS